MKSFGLLFLILSLIGCSKEDDVRAATPTSAEDIQKAQDEAFGNINPATIKAGEFVYTLETQQVFSGQTPVETLLTEESITITERLEYPDYIEFTVVKEQIDHTQSGSPHFKFKDVLYLGKDTKSDVAPSEADDASPVSVDYFNLQSSVSKLRKPRKVLEREPCNEDDGSCYLRVHKISYDARITAPPALPQITNVEMLISQEVPYLAAVLQNCFRTLVMIDDARPLILQCTTVVDYKFE